MSRPPIVRTRLGDVLNKHLTEQNMTGSFVASEAKICQSTISDMFSGRRPPQPYHIDAVADVLDLTPRETAEMHYAAAIDAGFHLAPVPPAKKRS